MAFNDSNLTVEEVCHVWVKEHLEFNQSKNVTLPEVNKILVLRMLGGIIFLSSLIVIGLFGNIHVLYVYSRKYKNSNYRIYVLWLAVLDILNCTVSAPLVIAYLFHPVTFPSDLFCKVFRFLLYFCSVCSTSALVVIAIDRCRKVLKPLKRQITTTQAKKLCVLCLIVAVLLSWPAVFLYGLTEAPTGIPGLVGQRCLAPLKYQRLMALFHIITVSYSLLVSSALVAVYLLIGRQIFRHSNFQNSVRKASKTFTDSIRATGEDTFCSGTTRGTLSNSSLVKTTGTLFVVTMAYVISAIPHHVLAIIFFINKTFDCGMSLLEGQFYYTFIWSYFINSAVNPFIYGFRDKKFRREIKILYSKSK
ncbi:hypothetical protein FSP39_003130 [Pinctada imbricata]|uniref:G-protein coupled receptors family 1 profile domain-containing protein n=1 Tax=Pinctada imbricata TaxID=66713 RepID=A0AA89BYC2_PINIB|nr:hypothetical protein FSP39_003130 [Pinctada imbricata]